MPILRLSARLVFLLACCRERFIFSVSARDVRLENGAPPGQGGAWPEGHPAHESSAAQVAPSWFPPVLLGWTHRVITLAADLANLFFPFDCRLCGLPLLSLSRVPVCADCWARVSPLLVGILCTRCGDSLPPESARFAAGMGSGECTMCRLAPPEFSRAVAFAAYDDVTRDVLHLLKFRGMTAIASSLLGEGMAQAIRKLLPEAGLDALLIPVPLFAARGRSRGFNQADLLAEAGLARLRKLRSPKLAERLEIRRDVLRRVRDTRSSFGMTPHERRSNLRNAFRVVNRAHIAGRHVVLIDDILTTGATARECARVLLRAGAVQVFVATYARTLSEDTGPESVALWSDASSVHTPISHGVDTNTSLAQFAGGAGNAGGSIHAG